MYNRNMKYLIINADDFGKFHSVNEGIIQGIDAGVITSTSLMVCGKFASEIDSIKDKPNISIGLHFDPSKIQPEEYKKEFFKQVDIFASLVKRKPDHIDSHKIRLHEMKNIIEDIKKYASDSKIPLRDMNYANFIDSFFGLSKVDYKTTDLDLVSPQALIKMMDSELKEGFNEMMCHAGRVDEKVMNNATYNEAREVELNTLLSLEFSDYLKNNPSIEIKNWKDLKI